MIRINENIWIGIAPDEALADYDKIGIKAVLNVACDLQGGRGHAFGVEYMQVGLIDGPGNIPATYYAAMLALATLVQRHKRVMVCCHGGGRSLAVVIMYLNLASESWRTWGDWMTILYERVDNELPTPHKIHREAFNNMPWGKLVGLLEENQ